MTLGGPVQAAGADRGATAAIHLSTSGPGSSGNLELARVSASAGSISIQASGAVIAADAGTLPDGRPRANLRAAVGVSLQATGTDLVLETPSLQSALMSNGNLQLNWRPYGPTEGTPAAGAGLTAGAITVSNGGLILNASGGNLALTQSIRANGVAIDLQGGSLGQADGTTISSSGNGPIAISASGAIGISRLEAPQAAISLRAGGTLSDTSSSESANLLSGVGVSLTAGSGNLAVSLRSSDTQTTAETAATGLAVGLTSADLDVVAPTLVQLSTPGDLRLHVSGWSTGSGSAPLQAVSSGNNLSLSSEAATALGLGGPLTVGGDGTLNLGSGGLAMATGSSVSAGGTISLTSAGPTSLASLTALTSISITAPGQQVGRSDANALLSAPSLSLTAAGLGASTAPLRLQATSLSLSSSGDAALQFERASSTSLGNTSLTSVAVGGRLQLGGERNLTQAANLSAAALTVDISGSYSMASGSTLTSTGAISLAADKGILLSRIIGDTASGSSQEISLRSSGAIVDGLSSLASNGNEEPNIITAGSLSLEGGSIGSAGSGDINLAAGRLERMVSTAGASYLGFSQDQVLRHIHTSSALVMDLGNINLDLEGVIEAGSVQLSVGNGSIRQLPGSSNGSSIAPALISQGSISLSAGGDIKVTRLEARNGSLRLFSSGGSILDDAPGDGRTALVVQGGELQLSAAGSIGTAATPLSLDAAQVGRLESRAAATGSNATIHISARNTSGPATSLSSVVSNGALHWIQDQGDLNLVGRLELPSANLSVSQGNLVQASGSLELQGDLAVVTSGSISLSGLGSQGGSISLQAGGSILDGTPTQENALISLGASNASLSLQAGGSIGLADSVGDLEISNAGVTRAVALGGDLALTLLQGDAATARLQDLAAASGTLRLETTRGHLELQGQASALNSLISSSGDLRFASGASLSSGGSTSLNSGGNLQLGLINFGPGDLSLQVGGSLSDDSAASSPGLFGSGSVRLVAGSIGSSSNRLNLTTGRLAGLSLQGGSAYLDLVGGASDGSLQLADLNAGSGQLDLLTSASQTSLEANTLAAGLRWRGQGPISMDAGASISVTGSLDWETSGSLSLASLDVAGSDLRLSSSAGDLRDANGSALNLVGRNATRVSLGAGGAIGSSSDPLELSIATLTPLRSGAGTYLLNNQALQVQGAHLGGDLQLQLSSGDLQLAGASSAASISLEASNGRLSMDRAAQLTASGDISLISNADLSLSEVSSSSGVISAVSRNGKLLNALAGSPTSGTTANLKVSGSGRIGLLQGLGIGASGDGAALVVQANRIDAVRASTGAGASATAELSTGGVVSAIVVGAAGEGYSPGQPPGIELVGGGGSGASAIALVDSQGRVSGIQLQSGGSGYTSAPQVRIVDGRITALVNLSLQSQPASSLPIQLGRLEANQSVNLATAGHSLNLDALGSLRSSADLTVDLGTGALTLGQDASLAAGGTLQVRDLNRPATIAPSPFNVELREDRALVNGQLSQSGQLQILQPDAFGTIRTSLALSGLSASDQDLLGQELRDALGRALTIGGAGVNQGANGGAVNWSFQLDNSLLNRLRADQWIQVDYTLSVIDGQLQLQEGLQSPQSGVGSVSHSLSHRLRFLLRGQNDAPVAQDQTYTVRADQSLVATLPVASDPDQDALLYQLVPGSVVGGSLSLQPNGGFLFVPSISQGEGRFQYLVNDGSANSSTQTVTIQIDASALLQAPLVLDVREGPNDPTPNDLFTNAREQQLRLIGQEGATGFRLLEAAGGTVVAAAGLGNRFSANASSYRINLQDQPLATGRYRVQLLYGNLPGSPLSAPSENSFTIDSNPGLIDRPIDRRGTVRNDVEVLLGQLALVSSDGSELTAFQPGVRLGGSGSSPVAERRLLSLAGAGWRDADGELVRFTIVGGQLNNGFSELQLASGSLLSLNTSTGAYAYTPFAGAIGLDSFIVIAADPAGKTATLSLQLNPRDALDGDGVSWEVESNLARLAGDPNGADANFDGIADATQGGLVLIGGYTRNTYLASTTNSGAFSDVRSLMQLRVNAAMGSQRVSTRTQLSNVEILATSALMQQSLRTFNQGSLSAPINLDPIAFTLSSAQSGGLGDLDASRAGTQQQITIDLSYANIPSNQLNAFLKWVSPESLQAYAQAGIPLVDLFGNPITQAGWYDYTQRNGGGDGARFVSLNGMIQGIEINLTDNSFGDSDPRFGVIVDPGVPGLDTTGPVATLSLDKTNLKQGDTATLTVVLSEMVRQFGNDNLSVTGGSLSNLVTQDGGLTWTAIYTPLIDLQSSMQTIELDQSKLLDAVGNAGSGVAKVNPTVDTKPPALAIAIDEVALRAGESTPVTFTFSEDVTGFGLEDIHVPENAGSFAPLGPRIVNADGSISYAAIFTPSTDCDSLSGRFTVSTGWSDLLGNVPLTSFDSAGFVIDTSAPRLTITDNRPEATINSAAGDLTYRFTFSEPVNGFGADAISVLNGDKGAFTALSSTEYSLVVTPNPGAEETLRVEVAAGVASDLHGNPSLVAEASLQDYDTSAPRLTITDNRPEATINSAAGDLTYRFTFSEPVNGFGADAISVLNGDKGAFTALSSTEYSLVVTPNPGAEETLRVEVAAGVASDLHGNPSLVAEASLQDYDTLAPKAWITLDRYGSITNDHLKLTIRFSEKVLPLTTDDFRVEFGRISQLASIDGGLNWTAYYLPDAGLVHRPFSVGLNLSRIRDLAGNSGAGLIWTNPLLLETLDTKPVGLQIGLDALLPLPQATNAWQGLLRPLAKTVGDLRGAVNVVSRLLIDATGGYGMGVKGLPTRMGRTLQHLRQRFKGQTVLQRSPGARLKNRGILMGRIRRQGRSLGVGAAKLNSKSTQTKKGKIGK